MRQTISWPSVEKATGRKIETVDGLFYAIREELKLEPEDIRTNVIRELWLTLDTYLTGGGEMPQEWRPEYRIKRGDNLKAVCRRAANQAYANAYANANPTCGHSACRQYWIDTGKSECIDGETVEEEAERETTADLARDNAPCVDCGTLDLEPGERLCNDCKVPSNQCISCGGDLDSAGFHIEGGERCGGDS